MKKRTILYTHTHTLSVLDSLDLPDTLKKLLAVISLDFHMDIDKMNCDFIFSPLVSLVTHSHDSSCLCQYTV